MKLQLKVSGTKEEALESLKNQRGAIDEAHQELCDTLHALIDMQEGPKVDMTVTGDSRSCSVQILSYS